MFVEITFYSLSKNNLKELNIRYVVILALGIAVITVLLTIFLLQPPRKSIVEELYSVELSRSQIAFTYLGYSGVILRTSNFTIGIDVANMLSEEDIRSVKIDFLVYTHIHGDHFNAATAEKIFEETGCVIAAEHSVYEALLGAIPAEKLIELRGGETREIYLQAGKVTLKPVYGIHPVQIVVFMLEADGLRIFHGGDSGYVSSIKNLGYADVAFLPTGDPSPSASPEDAEKMALDLAPKTIVLIHGSKTQHDTFTGRIGTSLSSSKVIPAETGKVYVETLVS
jgi:L-ascorbate metabolism protein UlaG (beta-lactamase superfamily)